MDKSPIFVQYIFIKAHETCPVSVFWQKAMKPAESQASLPMKTDGENEHAGSIRSLTNKYF